MEEQTVRSKMILKSTLFAVIAVAVVAVLLAWDQPTKERAEAASGGPEMGLSIPLIDTTTCPSGTPSGHVCVEAGNSFKLSVEAIGVPAGGGLNGSKNPCRPNSQLDQFGDLIINDCPSGGYLLAQAWVHWENNGGGADLSRLGSGTTTWPDCNAVPVSSGTSNDISRGCLTELLPDDQFGSNYIGELFAFTLKCPDVDGTHKIDLLAAGVAPALTNGAKFQEYLTNQAITPKVSGLILNCLGPTPTPSDTPIPPTATPTLSPTPTNTPTPLPPPSERPDVKISKVDTADPVDSGASLTYIITVESVGLQTAEDIVIEDTLPPGSTFISATSASAFCGYNAGVVTCVTADMAPTALITIDIEINAPSPESDSLVENTVTVSSSNEPFANTGNNKDIEQTIVLAPRSDVTLQKIGDPVFVEGGEDVTYALIARNLGPFPAQNVQIVDTLPPNATLVSAPSCGAPSGGQITCNLGNIAVNAEVVVEVVLTAPFVTRNEILKNSAVVSADNELFTDTGNNLAVANTAVIAPPPDLVITKTDSQDPILRRGFYSYSITVANQGLGDALNVVVTDTFPIATIDTLGPTLYSTALFVSVDPAAACAPVSLAQLQCSFDEILAGQQKVITLNMRAPTLVEDENILNSVTASASDPDENPAGNDAAESTLVRACFDVTGDLVVDLSNDIFGILQVYGLSTGDPGFDIIFDFDDDGFIGLSNDIYQVIQRYGQNCSTLL